MSEDEVFAALADRLDVAAAQPLAVAALSSPPLAKRLLAALLDLATGPDKGQQAATAALALAFQVALSQDGTAVARYAAAADDQAPPVGVLLLGFGGASQQALRPHAEFYQRLWPAWRVVATTRAGVVGEHAAAAYAEQRRNVCDALHGCGRLLVHILSNNGHYLWVDLLRSAVGQACFADRLAGLIFDCAAVEMSALAASSMEAVVLQTVRAGALHHGLTATLRDEAAQARLQAVGAALVSSDFSLGAGGAPGAASVFEAQAALEPRAPALVLTSEQDAVLPAAGVRAFAASLRTKDRAARLEVLRGQHVQLLRSDPKAFAVAVHNHVGVCELPGPQVDMARVLELQADLLADDVEVRSGMAAWSDSRLRGYLESGGEDPWSPAAV